jgi:hypothetical protein
MVGCSPPTAAEPIRIVRPTAASLSPKNCRANASLTMATAGASVVSCSVNRRPARNGIRIASKYSPSIMRHPTVGGDTPDGSGRSSSRTVAVQL